MLRNAKLAKFTPVYSLSHRCLVIVRRHPTSPLH